MFFSGMVVFGLFVEVVVFDYIVFVDGMIVSFMVCEGYFYNVYYLLKVMDVGVVGMYQNVVEIIVGIQSVFIVIFEVICYGGLGMGEGIGVGMFMIFKKFDGDIVNLEDFIFYGSYVVVIL